MQVFLSWTSSSSKCVQLKICTNTKGDANTYLSTLTAFAPPWITSLTTVTTERWCKCQSQRSRSIPMNFVNVSRRRLQLRGNCVCHLGNDVRRWMLIIWLLVRLHARCKGLFHLLATAVDQILNITQTPFILRCMIHGTETCGTICKKSVETSIWNPLNKSMLYLWRWFFCSAVQIFEFLYRIE